MTRAFDSISGIQMIGVAVAARARSTASAISRAIAGVSGAPAHSTTCTPGWKYLIALTRWMIPFCRVMRPTNSTNGIA